MTGKIKAIEERIAERMEPYSDLITRLCEIPGVGLLTAWTIVAEIGTDMSVFPTSGHLASWCGLCPGNAQSAGKRQSGRTAKGNQYIRRALTEAAWAASRISRRRTFFTTVFFRISRRAGIKKAAVAVAHRMLLVIYNIIRDGVRYREPGADFFDRLNPQKATKRLTARLHDLGYDVVLTPQNNAKIT